MSLMHLMEASFRAASIARGVFRTLSNHFREKFHIRCRSSHSQMFFKIGLLKSFAIFTGKHLCWCLFLIKLKNLLKKRFRHRCFPVNIAQLLKTAFSQNSFGGCFSRILNTPPVTTLHK